MALRSLRNTEGSRCGDQAARAPHHHRDHGEAEDQQAVLVRVEALAEDRFQEAEVAQELRPADEHDGRDGDAELRAHAAEHDDRQDDRRFEEVEALGRDEALAHGEERAGEAAEHGADGEGGELGVGGVDAERAAGDLVLAQRLPGAPDRQLAQAHGDEVGEQRQHQDQVVEEDDPVHRR